MERYKNRNGKSGVIAYEIGGDYIRVKFTSGDIYQYSYNRAGKSNVENMKKLAIKGLGLATYISTHVKFKYD